MTHPALTFALDIADKLIKLAAVLIGAFWTWWNYRKSRTYEQKLKLEATGNVFLKGDLFVDIEVTVQNIGSTKHTVQQAGTYCALSVIHDDLTEEIVQVFPVFTGNKKIEPGETIDDTITWRIQQPVDSILWIKLSLGVESNDVEWISTGLVRVQM